MNISIDISTGIIQEADADVAEWMQLTDLSGHSLDTYLKNGTSLPLSKTLQQALERDANPMIPVQPKWADPAFDTLLLFPKNDNGTPAAKDIVSFQLVPVRREEDDSGENTKERADGVIDSITDFLLVCDPDHTIQRVNSAADAVYGIGESLVGRKCYEVLRNKDAPCDDCPLARTLRSGRVQPVEYFDGDLAEFMEIRTYPRIDEEGYYRGFTLINRVVSHRREQESETTQDKKLQALGRMASGIAHDFNNMLAIILGRIQLMKMDVRDGEMRSDLKTIEKAALDSTEIIKRLQDFTRKREGSATDTFQPVSVNNLIDDLVDYAKTRTDRIERQRGIHIELDIQLQDVPRIEGNQAALRNAMLNLVYNAIDALDVGGLISIWTESTGNQVEIGVADTGTGMSAEVIEKIFDPFFTTKGERGNGLGLSEVYGIVNQHTGTIDVESTPGEGTTFLLRFPVYTESASVTG